MIKDVILNFEKSIVPNSKVICEPQLSKRNLYSHINIKGLNRKEVDNFRFFKLCRWKNFIREIAKKYI